jgi:hypothetical protein
VLLAQNGQRKRGCNDLVCVTVNTLLVAQAQRNFTRVTRGSVEFETGSEALPDGTCKCVKPVVERSPYAGVLKKMHNAQTVP